MSDLLGAGKLGEKFLDVVSKALGGPLGLVLDPLKTNIEMRRLLKTGDTIKELNEKGLEGEYSKDGLTLKIVPVDAPDEMKQLATRAAVRIESTQLKEQANIENILSYAAEEVMANKDEALSSEEVDNDWMASWVSMSKEVSREEMQIYWGKILAGEIRQPGTYSLRTLQVLRSLSRDEAEAFRRTVPLAIQSQAGSFIFDYDDDFLEKNFPDYNSDSLILEEIGLIQREIYEHFYKTAWFRQGDFVLIANPLNKEKISFPEVAFTRVGRDLLTLMQIQPNLKYMYIFARYLIGQGISVKSGTVQSYQNSRLNATNLHDLSIEIINNTLNG